MNQYFFRAVILIGIFCVPNITTAQEQANGSKAQRLYGKIVDSKTNKGIEAASIQLFIYFPDPKDSTHATIKDSLAGGMLTRPNGDFSIENFPQTDSVRIEITAIGYADTMHIIRKDNNAERDIGNIKMRQDASYLGTVTVVGQRPGLEMGIDRKTFNVEKNLTSTGGTAIDVMKNIPSVTVDVDGNVLLRNNAPQIFIDGLPTILTLEQIPADNIERIELFTNPSAKFDASSRGGIINIILKKNRKAGLNGIITGGIGSPDILNGNLTLNLRQGKFNFFINGNYNQSGGKARGETKRINKGGDTIQNYFNQQSLTERIRKFSSLRFGFDLFADNRNTITLSQNFVWGNSTNTENQDQVYLNNKQVLERTGERLSEGTNKNTRSNTQLSYKYKFPRQGRELSADVNFNKGKNNDETNIINSFFKTDGTLYADPTRVRNLGNNHNDQLTFQADYVDPKENGGKIETGIRSFTNNFNSEFNSFSLQSTGDIKLPLSNNYKYRERVNAAYFTYSKKAKQFSYQLGLRFEHSEFKGELVDSAFKFGYELPKDIGGIFDALFPSVFLTKPIGEGQEMQLNYTRRIRRPNFFQLNPFVDISDPLNLQQGNPQLRPEFTNSFEFNYSKEYKSGNFLGVLYFQNSQGEMTRYSDTITEAQYQQLNNAAVDPNAILNTFINAQSENAWGTELTLQQNIGKRFDFTPTINFQYQKIIVNQPKLKLSNEGFYYETKLTLNYRIVSTKPSFINKTSLQAIGNYESSEVTPQGKNRPQYFMDFALRRDLFKGNKGSLVFSINDVFNSRRFSGIYDTENFYQEFFRRRNVRSYRLTFTYRFGKSDINLFKRNRDNQTDEPQDFKP